MFLKMTSQGVVSRKLPVFVFPQNLNFYMDDQSTHKQILTLYNPYEFPVKFKVLSNAPNKYQVVEPEGTINPKCSIDVIVRHVALMAANCNITDKIRIQMYEHPSRQAVGKRDLDATLNAGSRDIIERSTPDRELFQQLPAGESRHQQSYSRIAQNRMINGETNYIALFAGVVCIIGLLLPTIGDKSHTVPDNLHLSINFKLILSYVLGMVTIIILRL